MATRQSKYWCFTVNNYTDDELTDLTLLGETTDVDYLVIGKEVGDGGTPHLQCYVEVPTRCRLSGIRRLVSSRAHFEPRKGTALQAAEYCKKDGTFVEFGGLSQPQRGRRTDLEEIKEMLDSGSSMLSVAEQHFSQFLQYRRGFEAYASLRRPPALRADLKVYVLWGDTGVGKSRIVHHLFPEIGHVHDSSLQWFDGYNGQSRVLLDDFRGDGVKPHFLLKVLDIYPLQVPVKGSFVAWNPERIYITSNEEPPWGFLREQEPLLRRLTSVYHVADAIDFEDRESLEIWSERLQ